jgi:hypothetical protein
VQARDWLTLAIAIASVIIVPLLISIGKRIRAHWAEARLAELRAHFATRQQFDDLLEQQVKQEHTQAERHQENRDFLDTMRIEALKREERIIATIEKGQDKAHTDLRDMREQVGKVHSRVDNVLEMLGNRRRSP